MKTDRIARKQWGNSWRLKPRPDAPPLVIIDTIKNAMRIVAMENDARLGGIHLDQTLSDARAIYPDLDCLQHEPQHDDILHRKIARWCERYTPLVALSGDDGLFLDITGCAHLFGGESQLLSDLECRLQAQGFGVQSAIADTAGAAWAIARYGNCKIAPRHEQEQLLAPMPLAALRLERAKASELKRIGFKSVGCLLNLPRAPITARFGRQVLQRLDQALGLEDEVLCPLQPAVEFVSEKRFGEPVCHEDDIKRTIQILTRNLAPSLERKGLGIRRCVLALFRTDGEIVSLSVETSSPIRDTERVVGLFNERLAALHDEWDAGFGFDVIRLLVPMTGLLKPQQQDAIAVRQNNENTQHLIDRLSARLGHDRIQAFKTADTHIPERRFQLAPAIHAAHSLAQALPQTSCSHEPAPAEAEHYVTRPPILFERPVPIEVIAEIPEGPPLRFRYHKVQHNVIRSEGPERIACEWWKDGRNAPTRDYFRIEDQDGNRFWLFRHGLYGRETTQPKWYLHGLFA